MSVRGRAPQASATTRPIEVVLLLVLALLGRLPLSMTNLALLLLARELRYSYAVAGVLMGVSTVAMGLAAPRIGRWADSVGAARVLVITALVGMVPTLVMALIPETLGVPGLFALALVAGASSPPIATVYRAALPRLVAPERLGQMYGLEAACQEAVFVVGPVLIVGIVAVAGARWGLATSGLLLGTISCAFALAVHRYAGRPEPAERTGSVLRNHRLRRLLIAYTLMGGTFGSIEVAAVAALEALGRRNTSGIVLATWAFGSMLGGLVVPRLWRAPATRRIAILMAALAVLGIPLVVVCTVSPIALAVALFAQGVVIAPTIGAVYERIPQITPEHTLTEAFSWSIGAVVMGSSVGLAVAGILSAHVSEPAAMASAALFPLVSVLVLWADRRSAPEKLTIK